MKSFFRLAAVSAVIFMFLACVSSGGQSSAADAMILDSAIVEAATYFTQRLPSSAKVAIIPFDAPTSRLSEYIFEEMWKRFEDAGSFVMVDRRNLERIDDELRHQYGSGRVDDETMASMSNQYGAQILVYGQITSIGNGFRLTAYATDVERASSSQRAYNVRPDDRLSYLLTISGEDEIERAVAAMARSVDDKTTIAIGRISYVDTQSVSTFSAWLKNNITSSAQRQSEKFQVATDSQSSELAVSSRGLTVAPLAAGNSIQAVVEGTYLPLDSGAEVSLQLISTAGNRAVLSSTRFTIPASDLERRRLTLRPEVGGIEISRTDFEARQQAIEPYSGSNNRWTFTVTPDDLDGIYYEGDEMSMSIYSERECYFRIIHVDVNGNTQVIYPTNPRDNNLIRAGQVRRIPDNTRFVMGPPFGEELILVSAYDQSFSLSLQSGTGSLNAENVARGIRVVGNNNATVNPVVTARFNYTILPRF